MVSIDFTAFDFSPLVLMVKALAAVVAVSFALGVAAALKAHDFELARLDEFVNDDLVPALVIVTTEAIGILTSSETFQVLAIGAAGAFSVARMPGIVANLKALAGPTPTT